MSGYCPSLDRVTDDHSVVGGDQFCIFCLRKRGDDAVATVRKLDCEVLRLTGALLDCEHDVACAETAKDMYDDVTATVEAVLGKPPRAYAPKLPGEPAVRA